MNLPASFPRRRRRRSLTALLLSPLVAPLLAQTAVAQTPYPAGAFDARSAADAFRALGLGVPVTSRDVLLQAPDIAENGGSVRITGGTALSGVRRVLLLVDRNPAVLSAVFEPSESVEPVFTLQVKMAQSATVHAVVLMQDGRLLASTKDVRVTLGGCGA